MGKLIRFLASLLLIPFVYAFAHEAYSFVTLNVKAHSISWFIYGFFGYVLVYGFVLWRKIAFLEIFEHELGHALVGLLFFRDIQKFEVHPGGGSVELVGGNSLIRLAPYYLPVFTIPLLIIKPLVSPSIRDVANFLIGFTLAFHYTSLLKEFNLRQEDIKETGLVFSLCVTCIMNIIVLVIILCVVIDDYSGILSYFERSFKKAIESYETILQKWG